MTIAFIIPTINEEDNVYNCIDIIIKLTAKLGLAYQIIFVDDQSTDHTVSRIMTRASLNDRIRLLRLPERKGLGFALLQGMQQVSTEYVLFLDCDLSINEADLEKLILARSPETMVIGSRYMKRSRIVNAPKIKVFLSRVLNFIVSRISGLNISDMSHSLRVFKPHPLFAPQIYTHPGFFWELSIFMRSKGVIVRELPVTFLERRHGLTKHRMMGMMRSVLKGLLVVLKYRFK